MSGACSPWRCCPPLAGISGLGYAHAHSLSLGFRKAMIVTASMCALGGLLAAVGIRNPVRHVPARPVGASQERSYCPLDAPPLGTEA